MTDADNKMNRLWKGFGRHAVPDDNLHSNPGSLLAEPGKFRQPKFKKSGELGVGDGIRSQSDLRF